MDTPIQYVKGVGPHLAALLRKKDIVTFEDALYFLPRTYENRLNLKPLRDLKPGFRQTAFGTLRSMREVPTHSKRIRILEIIVQDKTGFIFLKWFRYNLKYMQQRFKPGVSLVFSGDVKRFRNQLEIAHPDIEIIEEPTESSLHFGRIVPVYSQTEGLYQKTLRKIMHHVVEKSKTVLEDPLPLPLQEKYDLWPLSKCFETLHNPPTEKDFELLLAGTHPARNRLVFDEFFFLELGLAQKKIKTQKEKTQAFGISKILKPKILKTLPFELTQSQLQAILDIESDLQKPTPMYRLLQGDVGSGKTLVSVLGALSVLEAGAQVALMVPTEILAEQHFQNIKTLFKPLGIQTALLKSDLKKSDKTKLVQDIKSGFFQMLVGTHALIEKEIEFQNLGLCIIDEQHRFGVEQRLLLKQKGQNPHLLLMTATPIPRTLALTAYGDLDLSIMLDMPKGRKPVKTKLVQESQRLKLYDFIKKQSELGHQAYVIYPLIEESEKVDLKDATQMAEHLKQVFSNHTVSLLHGKMPGETKQDIMKQFKEGKIHILVSTTVIEVGVDVPNSTLMVVEHAERFGLSQLHQLRGRVGRSDLQSYCFLLMSYPASEEAKIRLKAMETHTSGFKLSEVDLELRGPGEFLGTRQSGLPGFRIANLAKDQLVLLSARKEAFAIIETDPELCAPQNQSLKKGLHNHWQKKMSFLQAG